jgi:aldose 1-epimerase
LSLAADGAPAPVEERPYGQLADGTPVRQYTLRAGGLRLSAINLGGIVTELLAPDRDGQLGNVVLGLPSLQDYEKRNPHMGTIVGRYANRIAKARYVLDGQTLQLEANDGANALHGGLGGFGKRWWDIEPQPPGADGSAALLLRHTSVDGDGGHPGRMDVQVRYQLGPGPEWRIDYRASCDQPTVVNLSHHDYFNLDGASSGNSGSGDVMGHRLTIPASRYCPVEDSLIPEGIAPVKGTPFDFREAHAIGERIRMPHPQLLRARGYDHNFVLDEATDPGGLRLAARLEEPRSGRAMEIHTTEPGLQFYSGNFLDGRLAGAHGRVLRQGDGLCLETQHFPDSPNQPDFPSTVLRPGHIFTSCTVHRFGVVTAHHKEQT